jgi:5-methylcytosine-specific restriction endonuclease McrA
MDANNVSAILKRCWKCKRELPISKFSKDSTRGDGLRACCKECAAEYATARYAVKSEEILAKAAADYAANPEKFKAINARNYAKNPEKKLAQNKAWKENNKERVREENRKWRENNRDKERERQALQYKENKEDIDTKNRKWAKEHPEEIRKMQLRYNRKHPEKVSAHNASRRARKLGAKICDLTDDQWADILELYNGHCAYCMCTDKPLTQDHIIALDRGGNHTASNVVPACKSCNSSKGTKSVVEWVAVGGKPLHWPGRKVTAEVVQR